MKGWADVNILFVCTGNTCRSPMAEGYLKDLIQKSGRKDIAVLSAGLMAIPGQQASRHSLEVLQEQGIDISQHQSRQITTDFVKASDWILTMTESQKMILSREFPKESEKIKTLSEFASLDGEIGDPFGGDRFQYEKASQDIRKGVEKIWEKIG